MTGKQERKIVLHRPKWQSRSETRGLLVDLSCAPWRFFALVVAATVARVLHSECMTRLVRNTWLPGMHQDNHTSPNAHTLESNLSGIKCQAYFRTSVPNPSSAIVAVHFTHCASGIPDPVQPAYPSCSDAELVESVSLVVTVKELHQQRDLAAESFGRRPCRKIVTDSRSHEFSSKANCSLGTKNCTTATAPK
eukprot:6231134-Amphidinium_carterae.1